MSVLDAIALKSPAAHIQTIADSLFPKKLPVCSDVQFFFAQVIFTHVTSRLSAHTTIACDNLLSYWSGLK